MVLREQTFALGPLQRKFGNELYPNNNVFENQIFFSENLITNK